MDFEFFLNWVGVIFEPIFLPFLLAMSGTKISGKNARWFSKKSQKFPSCIFGVYFGGEMPDNFQIREKMPNDFLKKSKKFPSVYFRGYFSRRKCQNTLFLVIVILFFRSTIVTADTVNTVRTFSRLHLLIAFSSCIMKTNRCKKLIKNCTQLEPQKNRN